MNNKREQQHMTEETKEEKAGKEGKEGKEVKEGGCECNRSWRGHVVGAACAMTAAAIGFWLSPEAGAQPVSGATRGAAAAVVGGSATTYAFATMDGLLAFMARRPVGRPAAPAGDAAGTLAQAVVAVQHGAPARLHVFAWVPASQAIDRDAAARMLAAVVQGQPVAASSSGRALWGQAEPSPVLGVRYATLADALAATGRAPGHGLYWRSLAGLGQPDVGEWAMRAPAELSVAARGWPDWLYVYAEGPDGAARLVQGGGRTALLDASINSSSNNTTRKP
jgi:hypothetical protein